jgi:hypothetical protein
MSCTLQLFFDIAQRPATQYNGIPKAGCKRKLYNSEKARCSKFHTKTTINFEFYQILFDGNAYSFDSGFAKIVLHVSNNSMMPT